jgi:hypothetical protein
MAERVKTVDRSASAVDAHVSDRERGTINYPDGALAAVRITAQVSGG